MKFIDRNGTVLIEMTYDEAEALSANISVEFTPREDAPLHALMEVLDEYINT